MPNRSDLNDWLYAIHHSDSGSGADVWRGCIESEELATLDPKYNGYLPYDAFDEVNIRQMLECLEANG